LPHTIAQTGLNNDTLTGQTVVITGAGRGIGLEAGRAFAWLGANVVVAELSGQGKISDEASVTHLAAQVQAVFGQVDILVNNAIYCPVAAVTEMTTTMWDKVIAVNLRGTFLTCRAFAPGMLENGHGTIINMISTDAMPGLSAYIASKQGIAGFSQTLAAEVGEHGISVIAFAPGMVDTPAIRGVAPELSKKLGMNEAQFLGLSLHPAYAGLMPLEHAGAATAYLAAVLSKEYHGEMVNGYTILERAGVISAVEAPQVGQASPAALIAAGDALSHALDVSKKMVNLILETEAEFNKLPVFVRPMARAGFKNKAGQSMQDWTRLLAELHSLLQRATAGDAAALGQVRAARAGWVDRLTKLVVYYQGVPAETARFTKDQDMLAEVSQISIARITLAQDFSKLLETL
jgi:3-hydroxybutyrate dehydrogenase